MTKYSKIIWACAASLVVYQGPLLVGALPGSWQAPYALMGAVIGTLAVFMALSKLPKALEWMLLLMLSLSLAVTLADLILRPFPLKAIYYRPEDMLLSRWPEMPELSRFAENRLFEGEIYGDLSALSGIKEDRETRHIRFVTDELGFRNEPNRYRKPVNLIMIGDSFGAGFGTTQDKTWAALLENQYGYKVYNLSTGGSPWDEVMNVKTSLDKLKLEKNGIILWALFTGNDLGGRYFYDCEPHFQNIFGRMAVRISIFQNRSPIRLMLQQLAYTYRLKERRLDSLERRDFDDRKVLFYGFYSYSEALGVEAVRAHENYPMLRKVFSEMKKAAEAKDFRVAVAVIPTKEAVYSWILHGGEKWSSDIAASGFSLAVEGLCREESFAFLDLKPDFIKASKELYEAKPGSLLWWFDDTHWNEAGHALAAKVVHERLLPRD